MEGREGLLAATLAVGIAKLVSTTGSSLLLDHVGRRPLLITSACGVTTSLLIITIGCAAKLTLVTIVGQCLFVTAFAIGYGPVCWIIISEVFPCRVRGAAVAIATALNRLTSFLVAFTWLSICKTITTPGCYALFGMLNAVGVWFCVMYVPETMGLSLEQITTAMLTQKSLTGAAVGTSDGVNVDSEDEEETINALNAGIVPVDAVGKTSSIRSQT